MCKNFFYISLIFSTLFLFQFCGKKDEPEPNPVDTSGSNTAGGTNNTNTGGNTPSGPVTDVCLGKANNEYLPLAKANEYKYSSGQTNTYIISDTAVLPGLGTRYTKQVYSSLQNRYNDYEYLIKYPNGDVYISYNPTGSGPKKWVPANPVVGDGWIALQNGASYDSLYVSSVNGSITIGSCTYNDVLIIDRYFTGDNRLIGKYYYKKGVGLIRYEQFSYGYKTTESISSIKLN